MHIIKTPLTQVDNDPIFTLGERGEDHLGNTFIYLKGVANTTAGDVVVYYPLLYNTARITATEAAKLYPVALAMGDVVANKYGWYQIAGRGRALCAAGTVKESLMYSDATAATLQTAGGGGSVNIEHIVALTDVPGSVAMTNNVYLEYPAHSF